MPVLYRVYPRVCGGTQAHPVIPALTTGLSPRVRGNQEILAVVAQRPGSIPACAGEPLPRGLQRHEQGSIPACAGEPGPRPTPTGRPWVYPRVCGGTLLTLLRVADDKGLSPRVRGNLVLRIAAIEPPGSIPACAGEPLIGSAIDHDPAVYPRVCGGTVLRLSRTFVEAGLSPRVRGNPSAADPSGPKKGSIPACAGEPTERRHLWRPQGVYPRVCGGTPPKPQSASSTTGLSPRVRGNRMRKMRPLLGSGSIPACAGEPATITYQDSD